MRIQGTLLKWDEERGFGYIRTRESRVVLPVHRSEFPHGQRRPQIGDPLSFDIRTGADGRKEACAVRWDVSPPPADFTRPPPAAGTRPAAARPSTRPSGAQGHGARARRSAHESEPSPGTLRLLLAVLVLGALISAVWYGSEGNAPAPERSAGAGATQATSPPRPLGCDGRSYCSEMKSCEDAKWLLQHCPDTELDYDGDGIPCEEQLCRGG